VIPARIDASIATVGRQFNARAARFVQHDALVREIAGRMFERLALIRHPVRTMVDLGCGYGACRAPLQQHFPAAQWLGVDLAPAMLRAARRAPAWQRLLAWPRTGPGHRICASAERLPLADSSIDLVFSNLMLHWHPAPHEVIAEIARVLRSGGLLMFSSYGPDTLKELRQVAAAALPKSRPLPSVDMHDFGDMLIAAGFAAPVMEMESLRLTFPDARALLAEVRALGGNPRSDRPQTLPSGRSARALVQALEAGADAQGRIALSFEIVVGHGWKAPARTPGVQTIALPRTSAR